MMIHTLSDGPAPALARALAEFEARFTYPLEPGRSFRISHGEDYPRFFRSMGQAACFVAEHDGRVLGVVGVAVRPLVMPDGSRVQAAYVGDLKVDAGVRGMLAFPRLSRAAEAWARPRATAAFGVVMDGTRANPSRYTGRAGVPAFLELGKIVVLRFPTAPAASVEEDPWVSTPARGEECYIALSRGRYAWTGGVPAERSESAPMWLVHPEGLACGRLEDTRLAKRLIDSDGVEMLSAHLACAAWRTPCAGAALIRAARGHAARRGKPAVFASMAPEDAAVLDGALGPIDKVIAPARVYGVGLHAGPAWNINTSEI
jgi:hypothetical protein